MAYEFYVRIEGAKQGALKGESTRKGRQGAIPGIRFASEVVAPSDAGSGQATGKRVHRPLTFVKAWGAASPQLFQALVTNEVLKTVVFEFVRADATGKEAVFQRVRLTNAAVVGLRSVADAFAAPPALPRELDEVTLSYARIELENVQGKTAAADDVRSVR